MQLLARYFFAALAISLVATPVCRLVARRLGFVARPREERWHRKPTAMFGGVAIALTTLALGLTTSPDARVWQLMGCGFFMAAFGLIDDVLPLKASTKLIAQIMLASALVFFGLRLHWTGSMVGDAMLTLFWIVGITNGFNLLDNMDGLCAGTTLIAGLFLLVGIVHQSGFTPSAAYLAALLGATTGFLVYNVHPASIFMGDTGSLFLGLNLAALTLVHGQAGVRSSGIVSIVAGPVLLLLIPIFDTTLVTVMRVLSGRRPSQGGRDHSSHRLVAIGLPESTAVAVLWALAAFGGVIALSLQMRDQSWSWLLVSIFVLAMIIFAVYLARIRVYEDADIETQASRLTPLLVDFMYKRRVAEVLLDLCLIPVAYYSAYHLRFPEPAVLGMNYPFFIESLPIVVACQLIALFVVGGYRGTWRFFGLMDAIVFAKGVLLGTATAIITLVFIYHFASYSREVFVIYAALIMLLLVGTRASFRVVGEFILRHDSAGERCVIYGTGGATLSTIREAFGEVRLKIIGFIDDDPVHRNTRVSGYSVLGDYFHLVAMIERHEIDCVAVNTHLVAVERLQELERRCAAHEVDLLSLRLHLTRLSPEAS
jgi:UDP-GlcNAc:undecaprenyl-phosphate/decaprenyl-phosphate GlcNAc-1-phosphate transferase